VPDFTFWELVKTYYTAERLFLEQYERYEAKVLSYARELGVDREDLFLSPDEVYDLLDLRGLEVLRDAYLIHLKDMSHRLFRGRDSTDTFDRCVTNIFHAVSILKEEHYSMKSFGPFSADINGSEEALLREVHESFPLRVNKIRDLFSRARERIEQLLPQQTNDRILVRSIFLFGETLLAPFYEGPLEGFYRTMYPEGGPAEGFFEAGRSFFDSGFFELAEEALRKALRCAQDQGTGPVPARVLDEAEKLLRETRIKAG